MTNEEMKIMDPYILLSWANTKLRDEFESMEGLCEEFGFSSGELREKLKKIGYEYMESINQFRTV